MSLYIAGSGPLEGEVRSSVKKHKNIKYLGRVSQKDLPKYYSAADLVIVPSVHEEGFGRVILEALACGTPVIGSNRGAIPEAMDNNVGRLINITPDNIVKTINYFYSHQDELGRLGQNALKYAKNKYSEKNVETIIKAYEK